MTLRPPFLYIRGISCLKRVHLPSERVPPRVGVLLLILRAYTCLCESAEGLKTAQLRWEYIKCRATLPSSIYVATSLRANSSKIVGVSQLPSERTPPRSWVCLCENIERLKTAQLRVEYTKRRATLPSSLYVATSLRTNSSKIVGVFM